VRSTGSLPLVNQGSRYNGKAGLPEEDHVANLRRRFCPVEMYALGDYQFAIMKAELPKGSGQRRLASVAKLSEWRGSCARRCRNSSMVISNSVVRSPLLSGEPARMQARFRADRVAGTASEASLLKLPLAAVMSRLV
jgi:hypothetical protein